MDPFPLPGIAKPVPLAKLQQLPSRLFAPVSLKPIGHLMSFPIPMHPYSHALTSPFCRAAQLTGVSVVALQDLSMSEEDQMLRAIAMSLGQDIPMEQRAELPEVQYKIRVGIKRDKKGIL